MARRQVQIFINGKQVENTIRGITAEKRKLNAELRRMTIGTEEYEKAATELRRVNGILDEHRSSLRNINKTYDKMSTGGISKIGGIIAGAFAVDTIVAYGKELFNLSTEMELLDRKAATIFGETLPQVTKAAQENAAAMGLTTSQYINASAAIADLLIPMEFTRQESADLSTTLVDLSGALSEWTGGQIAAEEVTNILGKAILGEREELKQLGISIQEADIQARLADKGLENLTGTMLQQAKATATLELITEKSLDAQTAFANNADLSARKQAELTARISDLSNRLATVLIPVFDRLISAGEFAVDMLNKVTRGIERLVDPAKAATDEFNEQAATVGNLERKFVPLLDRYDTLQAKGELNKEEQEELNKILQDVASTVPSAVTEFDKYGNALALNTEKAREFVRVQQLLLSEKNREAIAEQEEKLQDLQKEYGALSNVVQETDGAFANVVKRGGQYFERIVTGGKNARVELKEMGEQEVAQLISRFGDLQNRIEGTQAIIRQLRGEALVDTDDAGAPGEASPTAEERAAQAEAAEKLRTQREEQAKKALADRKRQLEALGKALADFQEDQRLSELSANERALEEIRLRYQQQIDLAKELEAQGVSEVTESRLRLEELRDKELLLLSLQQAQEGFEAEMQLREEQEEQRLQREQEFATNRAEANRQIQEITRAAVLSANELQIIEVQEQYNALIELAKQYGIDTTDIEIARQRELAAIQEKFEEESLQRTIESQEERAGELAKAFQTISNVIGAAIQATSDASKEATALQKVLTLAQIGLNAAAAISSATAQAAAGAPFPANLLAIGTSITAVLAAIAQARQVFAETPQFYKGRWVKAKGADDGRTYNARYIGQPGTGYLPNHPTLVDTSIGTVLGSERGTEYFVSNKALQNPMVMNYVQAIDSIVRTRQFQNGGATNPAAMPGAAPADNAQLMAMTAGLMAAVDRLNEILSRGILARIDDDTTIDLLEQMNKLNRASGGVL